MTQRLTERQLNRATLARQMLLERSDTAPEDAVGFLLGQQGQQSQDPYIGLWSRLKDFRHEALTGLITERKLLRATSMRATLHLHTVNDMIGLREFVQPVVERMWQSAFGKRRFGANDKATVHKAGVKLLDKGPMTANELGKALQEQFPEGEQLAKSVLMQVLEVLIQIPPTRIWGSGHAPILTRIENWVPGPYSRPIPPETLVRRYLAAYGPASVMDMQAWCGMTKLGAAFEALRPEILTFEGEDGRELFDLPDAPRPDADVAAPVRFLPLYDNVYLGFDNRRRMLEENDVKRVNMLREFKPAVLIDGIVAAGWVVTEKKGAALLEIEPYHAISKKQRREVEEEGQKFLNFMREDAKSYDVVVGPNP
ncbi:MAG TPA: winged helix DNA-binding domain-containing protein [Devosia sp.]